MFNDIIILYFVNNLIILLKRMFDILTNIIIIINKGLCLQFLISKIVGIR